MSVIQVVIMFKSVRGMSIEGYYGIYLRFLYVTIEGVDGCIGRVCDLENHSIDCRGGIVGAGCYWF